MIKGRYAWTDAARCPIVERFLLESSEGRRALRVERRGRERGREASWTCTAELDATGRVLSLEVRKAAGEERSARYRWDDDAWVGELRGGAGGRRDVSVPMARELEATCPFASFDGIFLERLRLPPLSQRRVEILELDPESLDAVQSHRIIERLDDAAWDSKGASIPAACYRWTDAFGRQEFVWVNRDQFVLARAHGLQAPPFYRLETDA